jgi:hypothetical protein
VVDLGYALVWLAIDEVGAWIPLPPINWWPKRPPTADVPGGFLGDAVVAGSHLLADVSNGIWNLWDPIRGGIDWAVNGVSELLNAVSWIPFVPLIDFEITEGWTLIATEIDALVGFAHDMINAGDQAVTDTLQGDGLIAAVINATNNTLESIGTRGGDAIQALVDWVNGQIQYFLDPFTPDGSSADPAVSTASALAGDDAEAAVSRTLADDAETARSQTLADDAETAGSQTLTGDGFSQPVADDVVVDPTDAVEEGDEVVVELSGDELEQGTDQGSELDGELPVGEEEPPTELGGEDGGDDAVLDDAVEPAEGDDEPADDVADAPQPDAPADEDGAGDPESEGSEAD